METTKKVDYELTYSVEDIIRALKNRESYTLKAGLTGDFDLIHIVIDSERVFEEANLTDRQKEVATLYWMKDLTLSEIGKQLGISHQAVASSLEQSTGKIQKILNEWGNSGSNV